MSTSTPRCSDRRRKSSSPRPRWSPEGLPFSRLCDPAEDEVELRAAGPRLQKHGSTDVAPAPGPPGDRDHRVVVVVERPLRRDVSVLGEGGPGALPGPFAGSDPDAGPLVVSHLGSVKGTEHGVVEGEQVSGAVSLLA